MIRGFAAGENELRNGILIGTAFAAVAAALTFAYLSSITIDDGLEALIFIPIIGVLFTAAGAFGGRRERTWGWVMGQSLGLALILALVLLVPFAIGMIFNWRNIRSGGPFFEEPWTYGTIMLVSTISAIGSITGCTLACGTAGWLVGSSLRRRKLHRLAVPPGPSQA